MPNKILLVGDIMLDNYIFGTVSRISPEAPVPVLLENESRQKYVPGGAANVAVNVKASGVETDVFSVVGNDESGAKLKYILDESGIGTDWIVAIYDRPTTTKTRYIGQNNQQMLRVDREETSPVVLGKIRHSLDELRGRIGDYEMIVLSDYDKGLLSCEICQYWIKLGKENHIPVLVDVKGGDAEKYQGATLLKPNHSELEQLAKMPAGTINEAVHAASILLRIAECKYVLATLGADGMILVDEHGLVSHIHTTAKEVYDVTGAGDTSLAYLVSSLVGGEPIEEAVVVANIAAGIQVSKVGTSIVYPEEVEQVRYGNSQPLTNKQLNYYRKNAMAALEAFRQNNKKVVFTNGCFDILHAGHIQYLNEARKLGDCLVVGVNSDASVRRLKGEERPVNTVSDRMTLLAALECVDFVVAFEEDTPYELIKAVMPDVLVKGGDYELADIVGADIVAENGGITTTIPFVEGKSTTGIIERLRGNE